jgi:hypothetical protein
MLLLHVQAAYGQQTSPEAGRLSQQVLTKSAWLAEIGKCPASIMAKREIPGGIGSNVCEGAQLGSCLAKCDSGNARSCYAKGIESDLTRDQKKPAPQKK